MVQKQGDLSRHLLQRIEADPRLAYYFDPLTQSMELLTEAYATERQIDVEEFRRTYYPQLKFEPPVKADDLIEALREAIRGCPCTLRERDSGHRVDCFAPNAQQAIAKAEGGR